MNLTKNKPNLAAPCSGCDSLGATSHTLECLFGHFMSYTKGYDETEEAQAKLKFAYEHGYEAGKV